MTAGEFNNFPHITQDSFCYYQTTFIYNKKCVPVGCVPPACWPYPSMYCRGRGVPAGGVPAGGCTCGGCTCRGCTCQGCTCQGVYLQWEGVPALGVGDVPAGGCALPRGCVPASGGTCQCWYLPRDDLVSPTLTQWPWYSNLTKILQLCICIQTQLSSQIKLCACLHWEDTMFT